MKTYQLKILKVKYDFIFGILGIGFCRFSFKNTSMTFLFDWILRLGLVAITKWQTKSFEELKKIADLAWDKKWKRAGYTSDPKLGKENS